MFGKEKIRGLEDDLSRLRGTMEGLEKEKKGLQEELSGARDQLQDVQTQLATAQARIAELEKCIAESENVELLEKARQTVVEYEGLKELYLKKNQEIDAVRESTEEGFAREAATKRQDLADEIEQKREDNREMIAETVSTFAGSYRYYLDQIRVLMDALSQAATETGRSLFRGDTAGLQESFGAKIVERLRDDTGSLPENQGDRLLIGTEEAEEKETSAAEIPEAEITEATETAEEADTAELEEERLFDIPEDGVLAPEAEAGPEAKEETLEEEDTSVIEEEPADQEKEDIPEDAPEGTREV